MDDLNAPLVRRAPKARQSAPVKTRSLHVGVPLVLVALAAVGINSFTLLSQADMASVAPLQLPEPVLTGTATPQTTAPQAAQPPSDGATDGVQVVYGDTNSNAEVTFTAPDPATQEPDTGPIDDVRRLSPGGAKIITLRDPSATGVGQPLQLAHLPEMEAIEETEQGLLPVRTQDGRRPMDIYARPWSGTGGKRIALVIGGLGLSQTGTARAIEQLPEDITLAFAPNGNSLNRWMRAARKKGHELLLQVPMEPFGYPDVDPGPNTLRLASSSETNLENLHWAMSRLTNYTGIMNYLGGRFATDERAMAPVLGDLAYRGLLLLNDGTASAQMGTAAKARGVPYGQAHVVIDSSLTRADILSKLKALEDLASAQGYAIGTGSALGITVDTVAEWANDAKKRGFEFVGISGIVQTTSAGR